MALLLSQYKYVFFQFPPLPLPHSPPGRIRYRWFPRPGVPSLPGTHFLFDAPALPLDYAPQGAALPGRMGGWMEGRKGREGEC